MIQRRLIAYREVDVMYVIVYSFGLSWDGGKEFKFIGDTYRRRSVVDAVSWIVAGQTVTGRIEEDSAAKDRISAGSEDVFTLSSSETSCQVHSTKCFCRWQ